MLVELMVRDEQGTGSYCSLSRTKPVLSQQAIGERARMKKWCKMSNLLWSLGRVGSMWRRADVAEGHPISL